MPAKTKHGASSGITVTFSATCLPCEALPYPSVYEVPARFKQYIQTEFRAILQALFAGSIKIEACTVKRMQPPSPDATEEGV